MANGWEWAWFAEAYFFQEGPGIRIWQFRSQGIKLLNVQNIVYNKLILNNTDKYIDEEEYKEKYLHFTIQENDLLYASSGGSWGKSAFFTNPGYKVIVNTSTIRIHPYVSESSRTYLKSFLDSNFFKNQMIKQLVGMQPNFGSTHFLKILVPIPPANEQERIAEKIAELNSLCDKLEEEQTNILTTHQQLVKSLLETLTQAKDSDELHSSWERISEHFDTLFCTDDSIDQLKETILQLAISGKLVKQNVNDELASILLSNIKNKKQELIQNGKIKNEKLLPVISDDEKPFNLPNGWSWCRLEELCFIFTKGSSPKWQGVSYTENPEDVLFVTSENVGSYELLLDTEKFVELKFNDIESKSILQNGDFLMNIVGGSIGRTAIFKLERIANINQAVCLIRTLKGFMNSQFLLHFFNSSICISYMFDKQVDNARANLSMGNIAKFVIPIPPQAEQQRIVEKITELYSLCDLLKQRIASSQTIKLNLSETLIEF